MITLADITRIGLADWFLKSRESHLRRKVNLSKVLELVHGQHKSWKAYHHHRLNRLPRPIADRRHDQPALKLLARRGTYGILCCC